MVLLAADCPSCGGCCSPSVPGNVNPGWGQDRGDSRSILRGRSLRASGDSEPRAARASVSGRGARAHDEELKVQEEQAARPAEQGAQIIVFPEGGIHGFNFSRLSISGYLETIPDPLTEDWNPCTQPDRHNNTEVLQSLSCMARRHQLYLVANMPDLQPCPLTSHPTCPPDGRWQFNTDVVFRSDGSLVARYHKQNLFFEKEFDTPPRLEVVTFDTPFAGQRQLV
ncbi:biotinidase-like [Salvelinus namaycush]|uniref:Biotinidase n=1 Tax=Salvelinus namaycush TaxID=8040 RepID=A0A8U0PBE5_SALNM|nr:biotinidase-like [Salvelinus namaycush]